MNINHKETVLLVGLNFYSTQGWKESKGQATPLTWHVKLKELYESKEREREIIIVF